MVMGTSTNQVTGRARRGRNAAAVMLGVAAVIAVAASAWACRASNTTVNNVTTATAVQQTDILQTTLGASGFTPNQVSHAAGHFELKVKNQSGEGVILLRLSDAEGAKVSEVKLSNKVREWTTPLYLAAGSYTLIEENHPGWVCHLTVQ